MRRESPGLASGARGETINKAPDHFQNTVSLARDRFLAALTAGGYRYREYASHTQAHCPAHEDRSPSLTIYSYPGRIRVRCWAGCQDLDVLAALGLSVRDLMDAPRATDAPRSPVSPSRRIEARRSMTAADGPWTTC